MFFSHKSKSFYHCLYQFTRALIMISTYNNNCSSKSQYPVIWKLHLIILQIWLFWELWSLTVCLGGSFSELWEDLNKNLPQKVGKLTDRLQVLVSGCLCTGKDKNTNIGHLEWMYGGWDPPLLIQYDTNKKKRCCK